MGIPTAKMAVRPRHPPPLLPPSSPQLPPQQPLITPLRVCVCVCSSLSVLPSCSAHFPQRTATRRRRPPTSPHSAATTPHGTSVAALSTDLQKSLAKATSGFGAAQSQTRANARDCRVAVGADTAHASSDARCHQRDAPNAACRACKTAYAGLPGLMLAMEKRLNTKSDIVVFKTLSTLHKLLQVGPPSCRRSVWRMSVC